MLLNQFTEREQSRIVALAIKRRRDIVDWKGEQITIPHTLNALFVCVNKDCKKVREISYYLDDVLENSIPTRVKCRCDEQMTRKYIGDNLNHVIKEFLIVPDTQDDYKVNLTNWFN